MLTQERLKEVLGYNPDTGVFTWKIKPNRRIRVGDVAGCVVTERGTYRRVNIKIDGTLYKAHRLVWMYVHGSFPDSELDHRDIDGTNNAIKNLRKCTHKQNNENTSTRSDNTSGYKGVSWCKKASKWMARIGHNGERLTLGFYSEIADAATAYESARDKLFTHHNRTSIPEEELATM